MAVTVMPVNVSDFQKEAPEIDWVTGFCCHFPKLTKFWRLSFSIGNEFCPQISGRLCRNTIYGKETESCYLEKRRLAF
jgi:hypothetical protein